MGRSTAAKLSIAPATAIAIAIASCVPTGRERAAWPAPRDRLSIPYDSAVFRDQPLLARRLSRSVLDYFRYTNREFVDAVCDVYADRLASMPTVNLHGDAHLEQYAISEDGRGLADFDAAAQGPPIVDLARVATSIQLAANGDDASARRAIEAFLAGYTRALEDPNATRPEPAAATRMRARFAPTKIDWLAGVEKLMVPLEKGDLSAYQASWKTFSGALLKEHPDLSPSFFTIKAGGRLNMGVGSAHAAKYLVRIEGPTSQPDDDVIMEAKELLEGSLGSCVRGASLDAMRVILAHSRLALTPQRLLGKVEIHGRHFYSHTWEVNYTELSCGEITSSAELAEVAEDIGLQLGRGHPKLMADQTLKLRRALLKTASDVGPELPATARVLAERVESGWKTFRDDAAVAAHR